MRKWWHSKRGQAVVETAILIPLLLFILMGIFVVGYWLYVKQAVIAAAREGARVGAQSGDFATLEEAARAVLQSIDEDADRTRLFISATTMPDARRGSSLIVQIRYDIPFGFVYFRNEYESGESKIYPFSTVVEQSVARLETDYLD